MVTSARFRRLTPCVAVWVVALGAGLASADEPPVAPPPDVPPPPAFLDDRFRGAIAVAQIVGLKDGSAAVAALQRCSQQGLWAGRPAKDPVIDKELLRGIEHFKPMLGPDKNRYEYAAYCNMVHHVLDVPSEAVAKIVRNDIFRNNLANSPSRYAGEAMHITGQLTRLTKIEPPFRLQKEGVKTLYEGWIYPDPKEEPSLNYCVVFTDIPPDVKLGDKKLDYFVACDAYFFKIYAYPGRDSSGKESWLYTPMFMAKTFTLSKPVAKVEKEPDHPFLTHSLIPVVLAVMGGLVVLAFVLTYHFRRGDQKVQARLREARNTEWVAPIVDESSPPPPPAPGPAENTTDRLRPE
jgi:hypothetical protein